MQHARAFTSVLWGTLRRRWRSAGSKTKGEVAMAAEAARSAAAAAAAAAAAVVIAAGGSWWWWWWGGWGGSGCSAQVEHQPV